MILTETQFIDTLDRHIMVFEYADSGSLQCYLSDPSIDLDWPTRCKFGVDIVNGLAFLHERNILHKNLVIINAQQYNFIILYSAIFIIIDNFIFSLLIIS